MSIREKLVTVADKFYNKSKGCYNETCGKGTPFATTMINTLGECIREVRQEGINSEFLFDYTAHFEDNEIHMAVGVLSLSWVVNGILEMITFKVMP